jgi:hypothetical protein
VADAEFKGIVSHPIYPLTTDDDVDDVIAAVLELAADNAAWFPWCAELVAKELGSGGRRRR